MLKGKIRWYNEPKGYGFIESGAKDYFVHFSVVQIPGFDGFHEGQKVTFNTKETPKGTSAIDVKLDST